MLETKRLLEVAVDAARKAGAIQKEKFGGLLNVDTKLADDIKLEADRLCEQTIVACIRKAFPDHAIMAEESGRAAGRDYRWYVDPLDGTVNFYYGIPYFCTTLSCYRINENDPDGVGDPLVGVTYAPPTDELFVGEIGKGATLNGRSVRVREETSLAETFLLTTFGNSADKIAFTRDITLDLSLRIRKTRNMGAAAYDLANVAAGRASAFFEYGMNLWDIATGRVLVEAAGGLFHAQQFTNGSWAVVASGKNIHGELLEAFGRAHGAL